MKYLSVCSGIEAATVAWHPLGWEPIAFAEIEKFPSAVLAHHYPEVPNLGDMTRYEEWNLETGIDVLVGGTPCQSFSVAGLRGGLDDDRGNLALVFARLVEQTRPRWVVWENVPGVLSVDGGRAFGSLLGALGHLGYGVAYRVLDAQYFGLAQRRKRVFVVGGARRAWQRAAAVLVERSSLRGDPPPSREEGETVAPTLAARTRGGGGLGTDFDCDGGLIPFDTTQITSDKNYSRPKPGDPCHPLAATAHAPAIAGGMGVRRITPREAERLQGFPDDYTAISWKGKTDENCPDGHRYGALGNTMAVQVMRWLGQRIAMVEAL